MIEKFPLPQSQPTLGMIICEPGLELATARLCMPYNLHFFSNPSSSFRRLPPLCLRVTVIFSQNVVRESVSFDENHGILIFCLNILNEKVTFILILLKSNVPFIYILWHNFHPLTISQYVDFAPNQSMSQLCSESHKNNTSLHGIIGIIRKLL